MKDVQHRSSENEESPDGSDPKPLCLSCLVPNDPLAHFCANCGAPLTSYAATGPIEHLFAEGHVYRQATERPKNLIVVLGIWIIFGSMALTGGAMLFLSGDATVGYAFGAFLVPISLIIIWKTTRNYLARRQPDTASETELNL